MEGRRAPAPGRATHDHPGRAGSPEPPVAGDEATTLLGFLERQRATFAWKCGGLDAASLRATLGPSAMTLGGMLHSPASRTICPPVAARAGAAPWDAVDWETDPDWDWRTAAEDTPEQLYARWRDAVARSHALIAGTGRRRPGAAGQRRATPCATSCST